MHGIVAILVVGIMALIIWIVNIPERKERNRKINQFKADFDRITRK